MSSATVLASTSQAVDPTITTEQLPSLSNSIVTGKSDTSGTTVIPLSPTPSGTDTSVDTTPTPIISDLQHETFVNFSKDILEELADIKQQYEDFNSQILNLLTLLLPKPTSCSEVKQRWPNSPSGFYDITNSTGYVAKVYCHMTKLCDSDGPWTRVAHLNMSNPSDECPEGFHEYDENGVRGCGRQTSSGGSCQSTKYQIHNTVYTQVCGRVYGYGYHTLDGVYRYNNHYTNNINAPYIDGVSLTYGNPRKHLWTFIAGYSRIGLGTCPCVSSSSVTAPAIIGNDYYCESHDRGLTTDPLWDGKDCWTQENQDCCQNPNLPWFHKTLDQVTSDDIELRVCCDQGTTDEDVPVHLYDIYVK